MKFQLLIKRALLASCLIFGILLQPLFAHAAPGSKSNLKVKVFKIDPAQSEFMVNTDTGGLFSGVGHKLNIAIKDFSGQIEFTEESIESASLRMKVRTDSFVVTDKIKTKDKKQIEANTQNKVLDSQNFPEIAFESTQVSGKKNEYGLYEVKIAGNLTLHGVTQPITINAQVSLKDQQLIAKGGLAVMQTDFKIKPLSLIGGAFTVKNEVDLTYNLVAHP